MTARTSPWVVDLSNEAAYIDGYSYLQPGIGVQPGPYGSNAYWMPMPDKAMVASEDYVLEVDLFARVTSPYGQYIYVYGVDDDVSAAEAWNGQWSYLGNWVWLNSVPQEVIGTTSTVTINIGPTTSNPDRWQSLVDDDNMRILLVTPPQAAVSGVRVVSGLFADENPPLPPPPPPIVFSALDLSSAVFPGGYGKWDGGGIVTANGSYPDFVIPGLGPLDTSQDYTFEFTFADMPNGGWPEVYLYSQNDDPDIFAAYDDSRWWSLGTAYVKPEVYGQGGVATLKVRPSKWPSDEHHIVFELYRYARLIGLRWSGGGGTPIEPEFSWELAADERTVTFDAGVSVGVGFSTEYSWDFADPVPITQGVTGSPISHAFRRAGTYSVTLTAKNPGGPSASVTHDVVILGADAPLGERLNMERSFW